MPFDDAIIMELARIAHHFWCEKMTRAGWTYGEKYDKGTRTHDALQPFDRLELRDKKTARTIMLDEKFGDRLASVLDYPRGPDRPFDAKEIHAGLPVRWADFVRLPDRDASKEVGAVESWELDPTSSELTLLRVRWAGGDLTEHLPDEGDLIRLDPST